MDISWTELLMVFIVTIRGYSSVALAVVGMGGGLALLIAAMLADTAWRKDTESAARSFTQTWSTRWLITLALVSLPMLLPPPHTLWEVRVALIKLSLASPENLEKGVTEIQRIGKKLECKYLGGCEEKKGDK